MAKTAAESSARFVFTNTADPTKDEQVKRVESRITLAKRGITTSINRASETKGSIERQLAKGVSKDSSIIIGMMRTGTGYVEAATNSFTLSEPLAVYTARSHFYFSDHFKPYISDT